MTDRDREAFEAYIHDHTLWSLCRDEIDPTTYELPKTQDAWKLWQAAVSAHAREAGAQEPVAAYEFGRSNGDGTFSVHIERSLPAQVHPEWPVTKFYTHPAPAQEPAAVPARMTADEAWQDLCEKDDRTSIDYPGFALIRQDELAAYMAAAPDSGARFMSDKTRQFVEPVRKMLAEGINVQALGEATNQIIEGAFRSLVEHIDELEMDLAALRTAHALASHTPAPQRCRACYGKGYHQEWLEDGVGAPLTDCTSCGGTGKVDPAPQPGAEEDCPNCAGNGEVVTDWGRYLKAKPGDVGDEAVAECPECSGTGKVDTAPQPGGAVKVKALEWSPVPWARGAITARCSVGRYELSRTFDGLIASLHSAEMHHIGEGGEDHLKALCQADFERRIRAALEPSPSQARAVKVSYSVAEPLTFTYRNWRGEVAERRVIPREIHFGATEWHPEPQWLMRAFDMDKGADRDFAMKDIGHPSQWNAGAEAFAAGARAMKRAVVENTDHYGCIEVEKILALPLPTPAGEG